MATRKIEFRIQIVNLKLIPDFKKDFRDAIYIYHTGQVGVSTGFLGFLSTHPIFKI